MTVTGTGAPVAATTVIPTTTVGAGAQTGAVENTGTSYNAGSDDDQQTMQMTAAGLNEELEDLENGKTRLTPEETQKKINEIQKKIEELNKEIKEAKEAQEEAKNGKPNGIDAQTEVYNEHLEAYNAYKEEISKTNVELDRVLAKIESQTEDIEDKAIREQKKAMLNAYSNYDKEKDGDWDDYLGKALKNVGMPDTLLTSIVGQLSGTAEDLSSDLQGLFGKMAKEVDFMGEAKSKIAAATKIYNDSAVTINTNTDLVTKANQDIANLIPNMVSEAEWNLVDANNVNIYEKMSDGSPRYIFAPGKSDGQYHIYDMQNNATLARQYCPSNGGLPGEDIVACGNGYISNFQCADECDCEAETVYYMDDCCQMSSMKATYTTSSPLSFDLNGDGVKTSDKIIDYDIDGDGKVDKIYDSADAVLVFDKDGDGISGEDGSECFGDNTDLDGDGKADGYKNGFEALLAMATKEGLVDGKDDMTLDENDLKVLGDKYGLKIKTDGYNGSAKSLGEVGITEINLSNAAVNKTENFDGKHNDIMRQSGATFTVNGETREYADVWHQKINETKYEKDNSQGEKSDFINEPDLEEATYDGETLEEALNKIINQKDDSKKRLNKLNSQNQ